MLFDPRVVFGIVWLIQIGGQLLFNGLFEPYSSLTWLSIAGTIVGFYSGSTVGAALPVANRVLPYEPSAPDWVIARAYRWFLIGYGLLAFIATAKIYLILRGVLGGGMSLPAIRQAIIFDFAGPRRIYSLLRVFFFGVGVCVYFLANAGSLTRRQIAMVVAVGIMSAVATSGRLYLLLFFVAAVALFYRQGFLTLRGICAAGGAFVALFFLVAILLGKGDSSEGVMHQLVWNTKVYVLSSVACFDNYIQTGLQEIPGGALIPNSIRGLLDHFGLNIPLRPVLMPFVSVPMTCNTYTAMFPLYHDGKLPGVLLGFFGLGLAHQLLFKWSVAKAQPMVWYLYAVSLYPLCMSIFEDSYFSSPGFWFLLWVPPFLHMALVFVFKMRRRRSAAY